MASGFEKYPSGGADVWDEGQGGEILFSDFFEEEPSGLIKVWTGAVFESKPIKVWDGVAFVTKPLKFWNGSSWQMMA